MRFGVHWKALLRLLALVVITAGNQPAANAQDPPARNSPEVVIVTAQLPGPAPWKVSKGDHVLWIFAYPSVVPEDFVWDTARLERALERSQEFLPVPTVNTRARTDIETTNPDGVLLVDLVPPALYQDYLELKAELFPDAEVARYRPFYIGASMLASASRRSGLTDGGDILRRFDRLARQHRLRRTEIEVQPTRAERRQLQRLYEASLQELTPERENACFAGAVAHVKSDLAVLQRRANAWAQGQVTELAGLQTSREQQDYCTFRLVDTAELEILKRLAGERTTRWHAAVDAALSANESTVALMNIDALIDASEGGVLHALRQRGYTVELPGP